MLMDSGSIRKILNINNCWKTAWGDIPEAQYKNYNDDSWNTIDVPHNWDNYHGYHQVSHGNLHGVAWYRKTFKLDVSQVEKRVFIEFEGVGSYAKVWMNGSFLGEHKGGRTGFTFDMTDYISFEEENVIAVRANHPEKIDDLPWVCGGCWGTPNTEGSQPVGIFRPVKILVTDNVRIEPLGVYIYTPSICHEEAVVKVQTEIKNYGTFPKTVNLLSEVVDKDFNIVCVMETRQIIEPNTTFLCEQTSPVIINPHLWSLSNPYLYNLKSCVICEKDVVDVLNTRFGMRWIEWQQWHGLFEDNNSLESKNDNIDTIKLFEKPSTKNNFFTSRIIEQSSLKASVKPCGVRVYIKNLGTNTATVEVKTSIKNNDSVPHRIVLDSFIKNYEGTKFLGKLTMDCFIQAGESHTFKQISDVINFPDLWTTANPYLHIVTSAIKDFFDPSIVYDKVETSFGIFETCGLANKTNAFKNVTDNNANQSVNSNNTQFLLNGEPIFINGTCEYEHLLGNDHAFTNEQIEARIIQIKAAGFNALREAHHPHNLRYLELCDELGILYWPQMGSHFYVDSEAFRDNFRILLTEWLKERRNSPAVILWGLQNESLLPKWFAEELTQIARNLDKTTSSQRKTTTCNGGTGSDWNVIQLWSGCYGGDCNNYDEELALHKLCGEYGQSRSLGYHEDWDCEKNQNMIFHTQDIPEEVFTYILETKVRKAEERKSEVYGHFQWLFATHANPGRELKHINDGVGSNRIGVVNNKGLLTSWGEPVDAFYMYRSNYAPKETEPMVYIVSHTWPNRWDCTGIKDNIIVYSNCDEVELYNDFKSCSLGRRTRGVKGTHFQWDGGDIQYNILYAEGRINGKTVATDVILLNNLPIAPNKNTMYKDITNNTIPMPQMEYLFRVNCGGNEYIDVNGNVWMQDKEYSTNDWGWISWANDYEEVSSNLGSEGKTYDLINGTLDELLHQTYRYGRDKLRYLFTVPNGKYKIELYFIEPWYGTGGGMNCEKWRLFDVAINGDIKIQMLDVWNEAGHDYSLKKVVEVNVSNHMIEISFPQVASYQAVISGIAICREI